MDEKMPADGRAGRKVKIVASFSDCGKRHQIAVRVDDVDVPTFGWTQAQMQALMELHQNNVHRCYIAYSITAVSVLLSLAAVVIAIAL